MKKPVKKAVSVGLAGLTVMSPIMDTMVVLAMDREDIQSKDFDWVSKDNHESKIELLHDSAKENFWFYDDVSKKIYVRGGTSIKFLVNHEKLQKGITSIEVKDSNNSYGKSNSGDESLTILLESIPSSSDVEVVYTFEDGSEDKVSLYDYFDSIPGGVESHVVDKDNPELAFVSKNLDEGVMYDSRFFKGKVKYEFRSDVLTNNKLLPNTWGSKGYKYELFINGEDYSNSNIFVVNHDESTGTLKTEIDLNSISKPLKGECSILINVYDNVGNMSSYTDTLLVDYAAPEIKGVISNKKWLDSNGVTYFLKSDEVRVSYNVLDDESGVKNVTVLKDSAEVSSSSEKAGSFVIDSEGLYQVKVEDNIGNTKTYNLSEIVEGVTDNIKFDVSHPNIKATQVGIVNNDWFTSKSSVTLDIKDDVGLDSIKLLINGEETLIDVPNNDKNYSLTIDSSYIKEGMNRLDIGVEAIDVLGTSDRYSATFNVDVKAPEIKNASVNGEVTVIGGKGYARDTLTVSGTLEDVGSGVSTFEVLKDGSKVADALPYVIDSDGDYSFKVVDRAGNETIVKLEDIVGKSFNGLVIDRVAPDINVTVNGKKVSDNWYKDRAELVVEANDNKGIKSIKYSINGKETSVNVDSLDNTLSINLENEVSNNGLVDFKYSVVDVIGNESTYSHVFKLDTHAPKVLNPQLDGNYTMVGNVAYGNGNLELSADVVDNESDIDSIEVLKDGRVVGDSLPYTISDSGVYSIRVTDNVGHEVVRSIGELLNQNIDSIVIDSDAPVVESKINGVSDVKDWYLDRAKLVIKASDTNIKEIKYSINGNESVERVDAKNHTLKIDLEDYVDSRGIVDFKYSVVDYVGNETVYNQVFHVDKVEPVIEDAKLTGDVFFLGNIAFIKDGVTLSANILDNESNIAKVEVLNGFNVVSDKLPFVIDKSGVYSVRVTDNAGHVVTKKLKDLLNNNADSVVVDKDAPTIKPSINDMDAKTDWYKDTALLKVRVADMSSIKSIRYVLNGQEFTETVDNTEYETTINLENYVDDRGKVNFLFEAVDSLGSKSEYSEVFSVDTKNPELSNGSLKGNVNIRDNIGYVSGSLELNADTLDLESGVGSIEILKNSQVVGTSLPFTIKDSGSYEVRVTDNVGHSVTKTLKDLTNVDVDSILVDNFAPVVKASIEGSDVKNTWYKDTAKLVLKSSDVSPLKNVEATANGVDLGKGVSTDTTNKIEVNLENYVDNNGFVKIVYKVMDYAGNEEVYRKTIKVDTKNPVIDNGNITGTVYVKDKVGYANDDIVLSANTSDLESGVARVDIFKDENVVSNSLPYTIKDSGSYKVRVIDNVGHSITKTLKELTGMDIDRVVVDRNAPVVDYKDGFTADIVKDDVNWYKNMPNLKFSITDDNLETVSVKVNNTEVIGTVSRNGEYSVALPNNDGHYKVDIIAVDKSSNTLNTSYEFKVDHSSPSIESGVLDKDYLDRGYGLYFSEEPTVSLRGSDGGIGVKEYVLLDVNKREIGSSSSGVFTLNSGEYFAKTVDYFGFESDAKSLKDLVGLTNNRLVVDKVSPNIISSRPEGGLGEWFNKNVTYDIKLADNIGINNAKVYINDVMVDSFNATTDERSVSLVADTSRVYKEDGTYTVRVVVEDNAGLTSEWSDSIKIDMTAPSLVDGAILGNYVDRGDMIVFPSNPSAKVTVNDRGVGLGKITLIDKDGKEVSNTDGLFELTTNEYHMVFEDKLGNKTNPTPLKDLLGLPNNKIVVDTLNPSVDIKRPNGIVGNWFKDDVDYSMKLEDTTGLSTANVKINGVDVINHAFENKNTLSKDMLFSTKGINPNDDGSYNVSVVVVDIVGNTSYWNDTIYIDKHAPVVDRFVITGDGYLEGVGTNSSNKYGFYMKGKTDVEVHVSDGSYTSGLDEVHYTLINENGTSETGVSKIVGGVAKLSIDKEFKGYISAYAVDKVGNIGSPNKPDGIIIEGGNTHINTSNIDIELPNIDSRDSKGNYLYKNNVTLKSNISDSKSGLREIKWGINDEVKGTLKIDNNGNISGDNGSVVRKDNNLAISLDKDLPVPNNENNISVWVEAVDRVGHVSKNSRTLSIDKDAPVISVSYDTNNESSFYNKTRTAKVSIKERNFRSGDVQFNGVYGSIGEWSKVGEDTWVTNVVFSEDNDYEWSVDYTDLAGNKGNSYQSEKFTIDKTAPVLNVSFDNNSVENGNFYKDTRKATVTVSEKNFNPSLVNLEGNGSLGGWSSNGNIHTASIVFDKDGEYEFSVNLTDKATNNSTNFGSGKFIVDKTMPSLSIKGVQDGVSYKKSVGFEVALSDDNIDVGRSSVSLSGRSIGEVGLIGGFNGNGGIFTFKGVSEEEKYDDLYTLKAVIYDKAGNCEEKVVNYSINRFGSKYAMMNERILNKVIRVAEDVVLEEYSVDRLDLNASKVAVIKDGKDLEVPKDLYTIEESGGVDSNWVYRYSVSKNAFKEDGKYQIQTYSKTLNGTSTSSLGQEYSFMLDTSKPEIIVSGIENGAYYNEVSRKVAIEVRDLSGVKSIKAILNGDEVSLSEKDGFFYIDIPESNNKQNVTIIVEDKAGNTGITEVNDFLVTSNVLVSMVNNTFVKGVIGALGVSVVSLLGILVKRRKLSKEKELKLAQEHAKMYKDSITGTSTNSSNSTNSDN